MSTEGYPVLLGKDEVGEAYRGVQFLPQPSISAAIAQGVAEIEDNVKQALAQSDLVKQSWRPWAAWAHRRSGKTRSDIRMDPSR